ncbi:MAG: Hsp20 family protein [Acholeplasmataceae bacterium]|nr:Hsp20 family protein [Acholeplasmataceae bacterium]
MFGLTPFNRNALRLNETDPFRNLIDEVLGDAMLPIRSLRNDTFKIDVREEGDAFMIDADLPGFAKEDIAISYEDGDLAIEVKKDEEKNDEQKTYIHRERRLCHMRRTLRLGDLDPEGIDATLKDGILSITAKKAQVINNTKQIQIK